MKKNILTMIFAWAFSSINAQNITTNSHPSLWVNANQITEIKKGIKDSTLKMVGWTKLKAKADQYVKEKLEIPTRGGNWEQYYINPVTGNVLSRGKQIGNWRWKHIDTKTKQEFVSDSTQIDKDYDGVVLGLIHNNWALGAMELGLAYQITGDTAYLNKAKSILLGYAALYPQLPERTRSNGKLAAAGYGKIHVQDLNEAQWLVNIAEAADLIWNKLSNKEQDLISAQLLLPAVAVVSKRKADFTNIQCWRNAAVGTVGFMLHNTELINTAIGDSIGFKAQLRENFNADGITKDLSFNYQFFALHPLVLLAQTASNNNYNLDISLMEKMFTRPIEISNHELMLPSYNDSRPLKLSEETYLYEWALMKFDKYAFWEVLLNPKRSFLMLDRNFQFVNWNLLYGGSFVKKPSTHLVKSKNWDSSGIVVLSKGNDENNVSCYLKYTNQLQNLRHLHNAQLDISIIKKGEYVTVVPGNPNYASPLSDEWYRSAVAHNTIIYNETEQRRSSGKCLGFGTANGVDYVVTATANLYVHSAAFVRTMAAVDENTVLVIDQFRGTTGEPSQFDLAYHQAGLLVDSVKGVNWTPPALIGYKHIMNAKIDSNRNAFQLRTKLKSGRVVTTFGVSSANMNVVTGLGWSFEKEKPPMSLLRFKTENTEAITVVYCISLDGKTNKITLGKNTNTNKKALLGDVEIVNDNGTKTKVIFNPDKQEITVNGKTSNSIVEVVKS